MPEGRWFYEPIPPSPYAIQERVRQTYWRAGLSTMWITVSHATMPYRAEGIWGEVNFALEWQTAEWLRLVVDKDSTRLVQVTQLLLGFKPIARYVRDDRIVYEWYARNRLQRLEELGADESLQNLETLDIALTAV